MKKTNDTTNNSQNPDLSIQIDAAMKNAGIEPMDYPEIVENSFLHFSFYGPYDVSTFLNTVSRIDKMLYERIQQKSEGDNWDYFIHPVDVSDDMHNPDFLFSICMTVPLKDASLVLKALESHNKSLANEDDIKSDS